MNVAMIASFDNEALITEDRKKWVLVWYTCSHVHRKLKASHEENSHLLRIPRRPAWTRDMPAELLSANERERYLPPPPPPSIMPRCETLSDPAGILRAWVS